MMKMIARSFSSVQEIPSSSSYSKLFQIENVNDVVDDDDDDERNFLDEFKSTNIVQQQQQQDNNLANFNVDSYQPTYYELTNISENPCSSSAFSNSLPASNSNSSSALIHEYADGSSLNPSIIRRKRKASFIDINSDFDDDIGEDAKSGKNDENKKQNHSEIEKRRRDKMNTYITELSAMIPMCHAMSRKLDKLTVLRMAVQHLKTIRGAVHSYTEGHFKPSFLTDQELKNLILQAADGFLFVVGCDRGRILYVSQSVSKILNYSQADLLGQSLFDILHPKDVAKVKEQLSSSDLNPRERLIDAKTMLPVKTDIPQVGADSRLSPGARRSFFCRMKCRLSSQIKEEADTTTGCHNNRNNRRKSTKLHQSDKKFNVIQCTGYLKSWAPAKIGLEEPEDVDSSSDGCNLSSCLVAIGKILPHISTVALSSSLNNTNNKIRPIQFVSRHALDGKFIFVDQRATLVLGFLPQEMLGTSMYEYYHNDDIPGLAAKHKCALETNENVPTNIYRFRTKDGDFIRLQSEWKSFKNPWTKEIDYVISRNNLILSDFRTVESSVAASERRIIFNENNDNNMQDNNYDYFSSPYDKDMQTMISSHVEASKIGRQIADQVFDTQKIRNPSDSCSSIINTTISPSVPESTMIIGNELQIISTNNEQFIHTSGSSALIPSNFQNSANSTSFGNVITDDDDDPTSVLRAANNTVLENSSEMINLISNEDLRHHSAASVSAAATTMDDGNDEAAMAVIMSLLEADAGLGGPVDFSGLPWPLP